MDTTGWTSSTDIDLIAAALVKVLPTLEGLKKTESAKIEHKTGGGSHTIKYANLVQALDEVKPKLATHGLVVMQATHGGPQTVSVATTILHESGQWFAFEPLTLAGGSDPKTVGSAITYARRYQLTANLGLAAEDDDGQAAAAQIERDELSITREQADGYVKKCTLSGLDPGEVAALVFDATGGRTAEPRLVLSAEYDDLMATTAALVKRKRQDAEAEEPASGPESAERGGGSPAAGNGGETAAQVPVAGDAEDQAWVAAAGDGGTEAAADEARAQTETMANLATVTPDNLEAKVEEAKAKAAKRGAK
jgi:hypothetical protein